MIGVTLGIRQQSTGVTGFSASALSLLPAEGRSERHGLRERRQHHSCRSGTVSAICHDARRSARCEGGTIPLGGMGDERRHRAEGLCGSSHPAHRQGSNADAVSRNAARRHGGVYGNSSNNPHERWKTITGGFQVMFQHPLGMDLPCDMKNSPVSRRSAPPITASWPLPTLPAWDFA